ncbi:MAG TPA: CDP-diacylglycerol--glycerol-3-phosphate 3-phosphatidyltransferase [Cellvibrionaceae bacterium]|nr:CDP-diacylglycerol--glycerol-3-phosphate 3-phosphatidyltransferase [Cellvibrionaceae bacterium]
MNTADSVNLQTLNMVRNELVATIEQAARDLELFFSGSQEGDPLKSCIDAVKQIIGILKLLQFRGASLLAEELYLALQDVNVIQPKQSDKRLEQVSNSFFVMTRYLEYVQQSERKLPVLLVPYINELRKVRKEPVLPESHFFSINLNYTPALPAFEPITVSDKEFRPLLSRLRHMYQLGLLGVLRNRQVQPSLGLMRRALIRLQRLGGKDKPLTLLWWLANLTIVAMVRQNMEMIESRKMLLSRIDRVIRQVQKGGPAAYAAAPPRGLVKELMYLLVLSGQESDTIKALQRGYGIAPLDMNDKHLARERQALRGPSVHTVNSLSRVLQIEITNTKNVLELASVSGYLIDDLPGLQETLNKIAETLGVVGLTGPSLVLKGILPMVGNWAGAGNRANEKDLEELAKILLYLESAAASLERTRMSDESLATASEQAQKQVVALTELAQAERIVVQESEAGLSLTKRAITAFSESGFDLSHIRNISKTLESVWGAMVMLEQKRAAAALHCCIQFVDEVLLGPEQPDVLKELLETFADVIISIEYFLDTAPTIAKLDNSVLQVAEDSLAALGYPVKAG